MEGTRYYPNGDENPYEIALPLFEHQRIGRDKLVEVLLDDNRRGRFIAWQQGMGKTAAILAALDMAKVRHAIIIANKSVQASWETEMQNLFKEPLNTSTLQNEVLMRRARRLYIWPEG